MTDPILDFRDDDAFYSQVLELALAYAPEWADYWPTPVPTKQDINQDPGLVLLNLFAHLAAYTAKIENQMPLQRRLAFFQFMNMNLRPPIPAQAVLQFQLQQDQAAQAVPAQTPVLDGDNQSLHFQTNSDLLVLPASLVAAMTIIPAQDQYIDALPLILSGQVGVVANSATNGGSVLSPAASIPLFVTDQSSDPVEQALGHWFMMGDSQLFKPDDSLQNIVISLTGKNLYPEYFEQWFDGAMQSLESTAVASPDNLRLDISLQSTPRADALTTAQLQEELYHAEEIEAGFAASPKTSSDDPAMYWLLVQPAPGMKVLSAQEAQLPVITGLQCTMNGKQIQPQQAAYNTVLLDVGNGVYPFGETPAQNDAFYLRSDGVFGKTGARITIAFQVVPVKVVMPVVLNWQFWDGAAWQSFNETQTDVSTYDFVDQSNNLQQNNTNGPAYIQFQCPVISETTVAGGKGLWVRVVIASGGYGQDGGFETSSVSATINGIPDSILDSSVKPDVINYLNNTAGVNFSYTFTSSKYFPPFVQSAQITYAYVNKPSSYWCYNAFDLSRFLFSPFKPVKELLTSFYFAFAPGDFGSMSLGNKMTLYFYLQQEQAQAGGTLIWQYFDGLAWQKLSVDDSTYGLSRSGIVSFTIPAAMQEAYLFSQSAYWFRIVNARVDRTIRIYGMYPNTVMASNITSVINEVLGSGNAQQFQTFELNYTPVLANLQVVVLEPVGLLIEDLIATDAANTASGIGFDSSNVQTSGSTSSKNGLSLGDVIAKVAKTNASTSSSTASTINNSTTDGASMVTDGPNSSNTLSAQSGTAVAAEFGISVGSDEVAMAWEMVDNFVFSGPNSRVYTLDFQTGLVTFGDGYHGMIPPVGHNNVIAAYYEYTQGLQANVPAQTINLLRPGISNITAVFNPAAASGGVNGDTIANINATSPAKIRSGGYAVQLADITVIAAAASAEVAKARAVEVGSMIQIAVLALSADPVPYTTPALQNTVLTAARQHCLAALAQRITVSPPDFVPVTVTAQLLVNTTPDQLNAVQEQIVSLLQAFFQPVFGGLRGQGWDFGQTVLASSVSTFLAHIPQVVLVQGLSLNNKQNGNVTLGPAELPVAGRMQIYLSLG